MAKKTERPRVRKGQIWEDCDPRMAGRFVRVDEVDQLYAYCTRVNSEGIEMPGRAIRLAKARMYPHSTGFRLISSPVTMRI